jgi:hypothetical protein
MNALLILNNVLVVLGATWALFSAIASILPAGKVKSILSAIAVDGPAVVSAVKGFLGKS